MQLHSTEVTRPSCWIRKGVNTHPLKPHLIPAYHPTLIHPPSIYDSLDLKRTTNMASEEPTPAAPPAEDGAPAQATSEEKADAAPAASTDAPTSKAKPASKKASSAKPPTKARTSTGGAPKKGAAAADSGSKSFKIGETVLARLKGYPPWRESS